MLSPCVKHRSSDAEDSAATSQVCYEFTLNVIKCTLDCVEHTCCGGGGGKMNTKYVLLHAQLIVTVTVIPAI